MPGGIIGGQVIALLQGDFLIWASPRGSVRTGSEGQRAEEQRELYACEFHFLAFENKASGMGS